MSAQSICTWSFDFMSDALYNGASYYELNILDEGLREALDIYIVMSSPASQFFKTLEQLES